MAGVTICSDFGAQESKVCHCFYCFLSICHKVMRPDAMNLVLWMLSFKPAFSLSSFTLINKLFSSSYLSAMRVVSSAYLMLLVFLPATMIPACASSSPAFHMMCSAYKLNTQTWHTPFPAWNQSVFPCLVLTLVSWLAYRFLGRQVKWSGSPISVRIFHSLLWSTQSKALVNEAEVDIFLELLHFLWSNGCWLFDLWFLCLF